MKNKDNIIGEQLAAVLREQTEWERRIKPVEKRIDKLEEYGKEIAGLKKTVGLLTDAVSEIVEKLAQNWRNQGNINKRIVEVVRDISVRVVESEASREEMRKTVSEISNGMQIQERIIREIEGFKVREQG